MDMMKIKLNIQTSKRQAEIGSTIMMIMDLFCGVM